MKKVIPLSIVLLPLLVANGANASDYQNKAFVGASVDEISMHSTLKNGGDNVKFNDSSFGGSINAGYKAYFLEQSNGSFFVTPEFSWNFTSLDKKKVTNDGNSYGSPNTFQDVDYAKYTAKPMFAFDLATGYELNQKHSIFAGIGLQYLKAELKGYSYTYNIANGDVVDVSDTYSKTEYKLGYRAFAGYEYNLTNAVSLNAKVTYSYTEPKFNGIKVETDLVDYSLGVKYNF